MAKTKIHGEYLDPSVISGQTQVTAVGADSMLVFDATDNALKKALLSDLIETVGATPNFTSISIGGTEVINSSRNALNLTNLVVDNLDFGGSALTVASGDFTIDVAGDIILDTGGDDIKFKVGGTDFGSISYSNSNLLLNSAVSNGDILFKGNDGGSTITALTLDMSDLGTAYFNSSIITPDNLMHTGDLNTYVGFPADDTFRIVTGGTEAIRVTSAQNVGIGTSSPTGKLHVTDGSVLDINLVGNPPELNFEDSSSTSGQKRARITLDNQLFKLQGLSDDDTALTYNFLNFNLTNGSIVFNEDGQDSNFIVESDDNPNMFVIDAGANQVFVNNSSSGVTSNFETKLGTSKHDQSQTATNVVAGSGQPARYANGTQIVDSSGDVGTKLIIPMTSQVNLWRPVTLKLLGCTAEYNYAAGGSRAFEVCVAFSLLNSINNLTELSRTGNCSSVTANGMNLEINFSSAMDDGLATYNGVVFHYEVLSITPEYVQVWNASFN